jgi:hypothetical protein
MSPAERCDRIIELIDRVLIETKTAARPKPAGVPVVAPHQLPVR